MANWRHLNWILRRATRKTLAFLGLERNILVKTGGAFVKALGTWLWSGYLGKVLQSLGARGVTIGAFGTVGRIFSILFSYVGGSLSDRLGRGRAVIAAALMGLAGYVIYLFAPTWWLFLPGSLLITAGVQSEFMGTLAMVGETVDEKRRAVSIGAQRIIAYFPAVISPPLGGIMIAHFGIITGFRIGVAITIGLTVISIIIQRLLFRLPPPASKRMSIDLLSTWRAMNPNLKRLLLANALAFFGSGMTHLFIVLYVMDIMGASAVQFGFLQALQVVSMMVLTIPMAKLADRAGTRGRKWYASLSFFFGGAFALLLPFVPTLGGLYVLFLLPGVRESFEPARKALIVDLAGKGEHGKIIGFYFFLMGVLNFPASFLAGVLWEWRPEAPFVVGGVISMIGFLMLLIFGPKRGAVVNDAVVDN